MFNISTIPLPALSKSNRAEPIVDSPVPITSGLIAQWESTNITGSNDGDAVSTWIDISGNGRHATATGTVRPLFKTSIFGTKAAVRFDGTDDFMSFTPSAIPSWTFFIVWKILSDKDFAGPLSWRVASNNGFVISEPGSGGSYPVCLFRYNSSNTLTHTHWESLGNVFNSFPTAKSVTMIRWNDSLLTSAFRTNAGAITGGSSVVPGGTPSITDGAIGRGGHSSYLYLNCDIGAILVYDRTFNDAEVNLVVDYLNTKYSIY